jgi:hypothetical protein
MIALLRPDPAGRHLLHALAGGAGGAGHEVRRIEVARLEFPPRRTQAEFEAGTLPLPPVAAQHADPAGALTIRNA